MAEIAKILLDAGLFVVAAFISPLESDREMVKQIVGSEFYLEVFVDTSLDVCENRDVKGLYKKARANEIKDFTEVNSPNEKPNKPKIHLITNGEDLQAMTNIVFNKCFP